MTIDRGYSQTDMDVRTPANYREGTASSKFIQSQYRYKEKYVSDLIRTSDNYTVYFLLQTIFFYEISSS